jgi:hypothetical protein
MIARLHPCLPLVSRRRIGGQPGARQGRIGGCKGAGAGSGIRLPRVASWCAGSRLAFRPAGLQRPTGLSFEGGLERFHPGSSLVVGTVG